MCIYTCIYTWHLCVCVHVYIHMYVIYVITLYSLQVIMKFQVPQMHDNRTQEHEKLACIKLVKKFVCFRVARLLNITVKKEMNFFINLIHEKQHVIADNRYTF